MNNRSNMKRVFSLISPLLIFYIVRFTVSLVVEGWVLGSHFKKLMTILQKQGAEAYLKYMLELVSPYITQITAVAAALTIPFMMVLFVRDTKKQREARAWEQEKASTWKYGAIVAASIMLSIAVNNLLALTDIASSDTAYQESAQGLYAASFPIQLICLGVLVPIAEEMVFRGVFYRRVRQKMPPMRAIFFSALLFAVYHGNMVQMIYGFVLGIVLAYFYERYGSVKAPILAHMTMNITSVVATKIGLEELLQSNMLVMGAVTVCCMTAVSAIYLFVREVGEWRNCGTMESEEEKESKQ